MSAADKPSDVMVLDRSFLNTLPQYDGLMFGMPTRFGMMAAQMKAFFDGTGGLWQSGALAGKLAATFVSTGTQQGGQETTHFTAVTQLVHHGMAYVPLGYQAGGEGQFDVSQIHGASPWGASTLAGADGSRQPSQLELKCALKHGEVFGNAVKRSVAPMASRKFKVAVIYYSMLLDFIRKCRFTVDRRWLWTLYRISICRSTVVQTKKSRLNEEVRC